jgi:PKD repeat protein
LYSKHLSREGWFRNPIPKRCQGSGRFEPVTTSHGSAWRTTERLRTGLRMVAPWVALALFLGLAVAWTAAPPTSGGLVLREQSSTFPAPMAVNDTNVSEVRVDRPIALVGTSINITATVWNNGDSNATVQVTATAVNESVGSRLIGTTNATNVLPSRPQSVGFDWSTTGVVPATYRIKIEAALLPGEANPSDNINQNASVELLAGGTFDVQVSATPSASDVGLTITFICRASDGGVKPYRYFWDYGDVKRNGNEVDAKAFSTPGPKTVICTVTDNSTPAVKVSSSVTVMIAPIPFVFATVDRTSASPGTTLRFTAFTSGGTGRISYTWAFGDGSDNAGSNPALHNYTEAGHYTVLVTVQDSVEGFQQGKGQTSLVVSIAPLSVVAFQSATSVNEGDKITFIAFATGGTGAPYTFVWAFGDGQTSTEPTVFYRYAAAGKYTPSVTVTDGTGATATRILDQVVIAGSGLAPSTAPPYFEAGLGVAGVIAVAVGTTFAVRRDRRRRRWGPRPR